MPELFRERDRPQFHFSYCHADLGDPIAMVEAGSRQKWHVLTIHNPFPGKEICWGHAIYASPLHWEARPPIFHAGHLDWNGVGFTGTRIISTQVGRTLKVDTLIDKISIEIFANEGENCISYNRPKLGEHEGAHSATSRAAARGPCGFSRILN